VTSRCFLKGRKDVRVNQFSARQESQGPSRDIARYNCLKTSGMYKIQEKSGRADVTKGKLGSTSLGNESRPSGKWQPADGPVYSVGCVGRKFEFLKPRENVTKPGELLLLID
jgi:hypothetical protein